jgi:UDP-N-acetylmuramoylalanine--D-glutamate ligase
MFDVQQIFSTLNRPVAVFGYGVSGRAIGRLLTNCGVRAEFYDQAGPDEVCRQFQDFHTTRHELVVYSPGFPQDHPWLAKARAAGLLCLGELDFASIFWKGRIGAITGTNGKTSLTKFLTEAFRMQGVDAFAVGNIGMPLCQLIPDLNTPEAVAVCEVSSFQSERMEHFEPDHVLWTNMADDHLDRHQSMANYFDAKYRLVDCQKRGKLFVGPSVFEIAKILGKDLPPHAHIVCRDALSSDTVIPQDSVFAEHPQQDNYLMARALWRELDLPEHTLRAAATQFALPKHRLHRVDEWDGVSFWNDSKATNFSATLAALKRFGRKVHWIGGGCSKGGDLRQFAHELAPFLEGAYLIGETARDLHGHLTSAGGAFVSTYTGLPNALLAAYMRASNPAVVLFSPGFASFGQFRNYEERGNSFEHAVAELRQQSQTIPA